MRFITPRGYIETDNEGIGSPINVANSVADLLRNFVISLSAVLFNILPIFL